VGSINRLQIVTSILDDLSSYFEDYHDCTFVMAGDFNVNLDSNDVVACRIQRLISEFSLVRCNDLFPAEKKHTYVNLSLDQYSSIDYILTSSACGVKRFGVLDPDINFSDHMPLITEITTCSHIDSKSVCGSSHSRASDLLMQLRWDKCNSAAYYDYTRVHLAPLSDLVNDTLENVEGRKISFYDIVNNIELCYTSIVSVLSSIALTLVSALDKVLLWHLCYLLFI